MTAPTKYTGVEVLDENGISIGKISDVVFEGTSPTPTWFVVKRGILRRAHYMPSRGAYRTQDDRIVVPYSTNQVESAPSAGREHVLTDADRALLGQHYHLDSST